MTVGAEEETETEEETNAEAETITTTDVKVKKADTEDKDAPQLPHKYYHTHGYCAHSSAECKSKGPGHQKNATTKNMQGGSTLNCFWL